MLLSVIPKKVITKLERIQMNFLWGKMEERRKFHLVNWAEICKDKKHGGLGLRHLEGLNQALLGKWLWRCSLERESHWRKVIVDPHLGPHLSGSLFCQVSQSHKATCHLVVGGHRIR